MYEDALEMNGRMNVEVEVHQGSVLSTQLFVLEALSRDDLDLIMETKELLLEKVRK